MTPCPEHENVKTSIRNMWAIIIMVIGLVIAGYVYASNSVNDSAKSVTRIEVDQAGMRSDIGHIKETMKAILDEVRKK